MLYIKCKYCNADNTQFIKKEDKWKIVQCKNCGLVYVNPQPDENFLETHYQSYLPKDQQAINSWNLMMLGVFSKAWDIISNTSNFKKAGRLLDIGCGYGVFLEQASEKGWDAYGVDLSESAVEYAIAKGLNVTKSTLFEKKYMDKEFDIVTMFYVLEHVSDPMKYLYEINRILKPNGLILIRIPNTTPIVRLLKFLHIPNKLYDAPSHLYDFSPAFTKKMLEKTGFHEIHTCIGGMTFPCSLFKNIVSCFFGSMAEFLYTFTFGKYLLPGVSKTTIACKI
jgi:2-polyprenyl-3-methyl-5-hydroxy-6-metoxy-1,4-benzoquinol methylase